MQQVKYQCFETRHPDSSAVKRTFLKTFSIVMTQNTFGDVTSAAANSLNDIFSHYTVSYFILNFEKNSKYLVILWTMEISSVFRMQSSSLMTGGRTISSSR